MRRRRSTFPRKRALVLLPGCVLALGALDAESLLALRLAPRRYLRSVRRLQHANFFRRELAILSRLDVQDQRTEAHALDLLHVVAHLLEHATYLPVASFHQRDLVPRVLPIAQQPDLCR